MVGGDGIALQWIRTAHFASQAESCTTADLWPILGRGISRLARLCKLHLSPEPSALFCNTFSKPVLAACRIP